MKFLYRRKKYLFPATLLVLLCAMFAFPVLFPVYFVLTMPSMLTVNYLLTNLGGPVDTTYFVLIGDFAFYFLIGCLWDLVADKLSAKRVEPD